MAIVMHWKIPMPEKILEVASWGKYIYRSDIERHNFERKIKNEESGVKYFIYSSQWLASLYVVVEGWYSLKESDKAINELLSVYEDYVLTIKRCRNAVYHYQKDILDKRVEKAVSDLEITTWAGALLDEFIRFLYIYPFKAHGVSEESLHLQKEYLDLVGWVPKEAEWVMWYETYISIFQYYEGSNSSLLKRMPENDKSIEATFKKLITIRANPYISMLSRIKANA
ncbi:MAG: hypothetical protein L3J98_05710 [Gammaproteobacteria bacterium]|nr:hypothetical protein [Gammaproteobacteria bacterium]MCF6259644.1 hypothetical protein [Gammaproteobacteria bacterium]